MKQSARGILARLRYVSLRGRHLLLADIVSIALAFVGAFALRFDAPSAQFTLYLSAFLWALPILLLARIAAFVTLSLYQRAWRYASTDELLAVVLGVVISSVAGYSAMLVVAALTGRLDDPGFPRSIPVIESLILIALVGSSRFALRTVGARRHGATETGKSARGLIVGAGAPAIGLIREVRANRELRIQPVAMVADDAPVGQQILGVPVIGALADLESAIRERQIDVVLLALPAATGAALRKLVRVAEATGAKTMTVPSISEIVTGRVTVNTIRETKVEDLIRRAPARIDTESVTAAIAGRCVLITGAGGTIGGELARQVIGLGPRRLVLLGRGENSIFETLQTVTATDRTEVRPVILDIRDQRRVDALFDELRPDVVFHAAAHKHVPLMELFPGEAVTTNVLGLQHVLDASERFGVSRFVFISSDKAVNPSSVMGATKRVGELLVIAAACKPGSNFGIVRFGNVLSSRGSIVPLLRGQLARGQALTITDPEVERYFMTIAEAVQLVLQAAALTRTGETFVLDMGEPVKILDLARDLVALDGLELGTDVEIRFTGLRPGEKLKEELTFADEQLEPTAHEAVRRVRTERGLSPSLAANVDDLVAAALAGTVEEVVRLLTQIVPEYSPAGRTPRTFDGPAARIE